MPSPFEIPGHLTLAAGKGGLPKVSIQTPWSTAEIYLHGAHLTAFQKTAEPPLLFLSRHSKFSPQHAIRGGVPICFPWFGSRLGHPAHGIARTSPWQLHHSQLLADGSVHLSLCLPKVEGFEIEYHLHIGEKLTLQLVIKNTSLQPVTFENCLHTYLHVSAVEQISLSGLAATTYLDKLRGLQPFESVSTLHIQQEVDRIYLDTPATVEITDPGYQRMIRIEKSGSSSTVVWNPWQEKSLTMPDMGPDEYHQMVCVESGNITPTPITLSPGRAAEMQVILSSRSL